MGRSAGRPFGAKGRRSPWVSSRSAQLRGWRSLRRPLFFPRLMKIEVAGKVGSRMNRYATVLVVVAALALGAQSAAAAPTPSSYRAQLNRLCRSYTPKLKQDAEKMRQALTAKQPRAFGLALAHSIRLTLAQDAAIEKAPVPSAMRAQMRPILRLFRTADGHLRRAAQFGSNGNVRGVLGELQQVAKLSPPLNRRLDRAGLRDCGSNQT